MMNFELILYCCIKSSQVTSQPKLAWAIGFLLPVKIRSRVNKIIMSNIEIKNQVTPRFLTEYHRVSQGIETINERREK